MARRTTRVTAVVLARTKLKEQDLIITAISDNGAQIRAIAKGARKPGSRLAARTDVFCQTDLLLSSGRGLDIVSEAEIVDAHAIIRRSPELVAAASALCEVSRLTCYEDVEDPYLFRILVRALETLGEAASERNRELVVAAFGMKVLSHCGWRPELEYCVACGEPSGTRFCITAGGLLCESCAKDVAGATPVSAEIVRWISALVNTRFDTLASCEVDAATSVYLLKLSHVWCATHLDARMRAFEFYCGA